MNKNKKSYLYKNKYLLNSKNQKNIKLKKELINVPLIRQYSNYDCGAACVQSILGYFNFNVRLEDIIKTFKMNKNNCINCYEIPPFLKFFDIDSEIKKDFTIKELENCLDKNQPIMVALQSNKPSNVKWKDCYNQGHFVIIIGYDKDYYYCMDPSTLGYRTFIDKKEFEKRWHDKDYYNEVVHNFAIIILNKRKKEFSSNTIYKEEIFFKLD
ncbi:MAG: C39 family peptidase [Candidatus Nanoarchaeia archaeon]|nr:C39 family peptidase [Candidatus Nanoarchaeia archaeon]